MGQNDDKFAASQIDAGMSPSCTFKLIRTREKEQEGFLKGPFVLIVIRLYLGLYIHTRVYACIYTQCV